jgi:small subunit ribosomal protein S20
MPISLSAKKSNRKSSKNRKVNVIWKNKYKTVVKKFLLEPKKEGLQEVYSIIDKLAKKFIFHKNKASRLKSKFARKLKSLAKLEKTVANKKTTKKEVVSKKIVKKEVVSKKVAKKEVVSKEITKKKVASKETKKKEKSVK